MDVHGRHAQGRDPAQVRDVELRLAAVVEELAGCAVRALRRQDRSRALVYLTQLARTTRDGEATASRLLTLEQPPVSDADGPQADG